MQYGGAANANSAAAGICGDGAQCFGGGPEQYVEHGLLVVAGNCGHLAWQSEKTIWKLGTGRMSRALASIHLWAAAPWHVGQCRLRQEL